MSAPRPRPRPHQGTTAQQIEALDRGLREMAETVAAFARIAQIARADADLARSQCAYMYSQLAAVVARKGMDADEAGPMVDAGGLPQCPHPETITGHRDKADEELLADLAAELWPDGEYDESGEPGGDQP